MSCSEIVDSDYVNELDPKSKNYTPTPPEIESIVFQYNEIGIKITWKDNSFGEVKFIIERRKGYSTEIDVVGEVSADSTNFFDSFIPDLNETYYYRIKAVSPNGNFSYSQQKSYRTSQLSSPTDLSIISNDPFSVNLKWKDNSTVEDGFIVSLRILNLPNSSFQTLGTVPSNVTQFTIENLDTNNIYELKVTAFNTFYYADCDSTFSFVYGIEISQIWQSNNHLGSRKSQFSPTSNTLAIAASSSGISFYDFSTLEYKTTNFYKNNLVYSPIGDKLAIHNILDPPNPISLVNLTSFTIEKIVDTSATGFCFSADGEYMFIWNQNIPEIKLVKLANLNLIWSKNIYSVRNASFNNLGNHIYCNTGTEIVTLNTSDGTFISRLDPQGYNIGSFAITNDESTIIMDVSKLPYYSGGSVEIWDLNSKTLIKFIDSIFLTITLSQDQKYLALGWTEFSLFRLSDFEKLSINNPSWGGSVNSISFNPSSSLVSVCYDYDYPKVFTINKKWVKRLL